MWRLSIVLVIGFLLAACSSSESDLPPQAGGPDVESLRVTGTESVASGEARLSPDGKRLLQMTREPCVSALDGADERCVDRERVNADLAYATWSPDGTRLAFTDDFWRLFHEPDVWVFDVTDGSLRNLTDDGEERFDVGGENPDADIDLLPSWSPDGETVRFARGHAESDTVRLMTVPADGGEPEQVREIRCGAIQLVGLAWSADQVAWTCGVQEAGVWLAGHVVGEPEEVLAGKEGEDRMLVSFSPDGQWLLVDSRSAYSQLDSRGGLATVVPVGGGDPVPVADGDVAFPTWSPGGHAIAYVELAGPGEDATLNVVAEPGGEPRRLHSAERLGAADTLRLNWAPDALLTHTGRESLLLTLS